ncbi:hypothetical protein [Oligoflexus tunisiensis]|uniref:hypothetical protein n=1 Tax=Oligoflexus tunisiensis TaxID=708132 RepID=UPI00114CDE9E|nr:hypothetical protein [Oligoflexus tunisiensis]
MQKPLIWILPVLILPLTACLSTLMGTKDTHSRSYRIPEPGDGWVPIDPGDADRAFRNSRDQAILNVTSVCGETTYKPLEQLSTDILRQLPEHEVVEPPQATVVNGHPALITEARGQVDGKPLNVRVAVVRTPNCLFDFILAGSQLDRSSRIAFEQSLQGFRERSAR